MHIVQSPSSLCRLNQQSEKAKPKKYDEESGVQVQQLGEGGGVNELVSHASGVAGATLGLVGRNWPLWSLEAGQVDEVIIRQTCQTRNTFKRLHL